MFWAVGLYNFIVVGSDLNGSDEGSDTAVVEGDNATLICKIQLTGNVVPNILWTDTNGR